jgi:transposase
MQKCVQVPLEEEVTALPTNARTEGLNVPIQELKRRAYGYRNRDRFPNAIYFHLGGLDL